MRISLSSPVRRTAFLSGCATACLLTWAFCWQSLGESWAAHSGTVRGFERAARIQPLNAYYPQVLGTTLLGSDFELASAMLQRSARINPHSSDTWLALAQLYAIQGDRARQHDAILQALAADPRDINVDWTAANVFLQNGELDSGLRLIRDVVENDPSRAQPAMQVAYRATGGELAATVKAIPLTATARLQFMRWLIEHDQASAADQVWPTVLQGHGKLKATDVLFYLDSLVSRGDPKRAYSAWTSVAPLDPDIQRRTDPDNLVVNGDFENAILNGGFDWRYSPVDGVTVTVDTSTFHGGTRSLSLQFDAGNISDAGVWELVPVEPDSRYVISGFTHADDLESANGVRLAVSDYYSHAILCLGEEIVGSTGWRETTADFVSGPDTRLVKISLVRSPSFGRIRGQLWVDDIRIQKRQP